MWRLHQPALRFSLRQHSCDFQVFSVHASVCDFVIFFPASLLHAVSPSWQRGRSGQGKRKAWPKNLLKAPAHLSGLACGYALLSFSLAPKIEGCWTIFSFCLKKKKVIVIVFSLAESLAWPVPKKVIYRYFSVLILPLFGPPFSFVHWNFPSLISVLLLHLEKSPKTLYMCLLCFLTEQNLSQPKSCTLISYLHFVFSVHWIGISPNST